MAELERWKKMNEEWSQFSFNVKERDIMNFIRVFFHSFFHYFIALPPQNVGSAGICPLRVSIQRVDLLHRFWKPSSFSLPHLFWIKKSGQIEPQANNTWIVLVVSIFDASMFWNIFQCCLQYLIAWSLTDWFVCKQSMNVNGILKVFRTHFIHFVFRGQLNSFKAIHELRFDHGVEESEFSWYICTSSVPKNWNGHGQYWK